MELVTGRSFIRHTSGLEYSFLHLHPYYTYSFTVAAVTVSPGPPSEIVTVTTLETGKFLRILYLLSRSVSTLHYFFKISAPSSAPANVTLIYVTSTSFTLTWEPPLLEDQNGELVEYSFLLTSLTDDIEQELTTSDRELLVDELVPYTRYKIQIAAGTAEGTGPFTDSLIVQTEQDGTNFFVRFFLSLQSIYKMFLFVLYTI